MTFQSNFCSSVPIQWLALDAEKLLVQKWLLWTHIGHRSKIFKLGGGGECTLHPLFERSCQFLCFVRSSSNPIYKTWTRYENGPTTNLQNCKCQQVSTSILLGQNAGKSLWNKVFWYAVIANNHEVMPRTRQIWYSRNVKNTEVTNAHCNFSTHFLSHYFDIKSNSFFILSL